MISKRQEARKFKHSSELSSKVEESKEVLWGKLGRSKWDVTFGRYE